MPTALPILLKGLSLFSITVGTLYTTTGTDMLAGPSVFSPKTQSSALADSQIRFFGGVLAGVGGIFWWASNDVYERQMPLAMLAVGLLAGVVGRALAGRKHGFGPNMKLYMWVEAIGVALVYGVGKVVGEW